MDAQGRGCRPKRMDSRWGRASYEHPSPVCIQALNIFVKDRFSRFPARLRLCMHSANPLRISPDGGLPVLMVFHVLLPKKKTADTINRRFLCGILVSAGLSMSGRLASELFSGCGAIPSGSSMNRGHLLFRILSALYHPSHVCLNRHLFYFFPIRFLDPQTQTSVRSSDRLADGNVMDRCPDQFSSGRRLCHLVPPPQ